MKKGIVSSLIMKQGLPSSVFISILCVVNLYIFLFGLLPVDTQVQEMMEIYHNQEDTEFELLVAIAISAPFVLLTAYVWMLVIVITHVICLIITIKNRKAEDNRIRICNYVLDVVNVFLIVGPLVKTLPYLYGENIF